MRVLVTGSAGMLGFALRESAPPGVEVLEGDLPAVDIRDRGAVERALREGRAEAVINAAAYTDVDGCESHESEALAVNGTGAGHVAAACAAAGLPVLHLSTDYVFDGRIPAPGEYVEADAVAPLSAYGRTKLAGERAVAAAGGPHWIVRTQWLYGLRGKNFVDTMLRLAGERESLAVVDDQVGSPTSTHDLAPVLWRVLQRRPPPGLYHATNAGSCSWHDFAAEIFRQAGIQLDLRRTDSRSLARPAPRPGRSVLSNAKLVAALGVGLPRWEDALARYLARRSTEVAR
ncbi:MAG TPA: dTDP-4-dehydrorhamnose reductase [Planctomycetota bacterium]|nr:dTDP-4-dehydrorhamnose reductase [Planctomycetota bacterium]